MKKSEKKRRSEREKERGEVGESKTGDGRTDNREMSLGMEFLFETGEWRSETR